MSTTQREGLHFDLGTMQSTYALRTRYWMSVSLLLHVENLGRKTQFSCAFCSILPQINQLRGVTVNLPSKPQSLPLNSVPRCPAQICFCKLHQGPSPALGLQGPSPTYLQVQEQAFIRGTEWTESRFWLKGWTSPPYRGLEKAFIMSQTEGCRDHPRLRELSRAQRTTRHPNH